MNRALVAIVVLAMLIIAVNFLAPDGTQERLAERAAGVAANQGTAASASRSPAPTTSRPESRD
jgi:hypothetical protein